MKEHILIILALIPIIGSIFILGIRSEKKVKEVGLIISLLTF